MTLSKARLTHLRRIAPSGGTARAQQFTSEYQRNAGKAGFRVTASKYGHDFALSKAAAKRALHPSTLEQRVIDVLTQIGATDYDRERMIPGTLMYVDFLFQTRHIAIEVDGDHWHDPASAPDQQQPARDLAKNERLHALGYRLIRLSQADITRTDFVEHLRRLVYA